MRKAIAIILLILTLMMVSTSWALADDTGAAAGGSVITAEDQAIINNMNNQLSGRITHFLGIARYVGMALAALGIAVAGLRMIGVTAGGEMVAQREVHTLTQAVKYSAIALLILLLLGPIVKVGSTIGSHYAWNPDPASWGYSTTIDADSYEGGNAPVESGEEGQLNNP